MFVSLNDINPSTTDIFIFVNGVMREGSSSSWRAMLVADPHTCLGVSMHAGIDACSSIRDYHHQRVNFWWHLATSNDHERGQRGGEIGQSAWAWLTNMVTLNPSETQAKDGWCRNSMRYGLWWWYKGKNMGKGVNVYHEGEEEEKEEDKNDEGGNSLSMFDLFFTHPLCISERERGIPQSGRGCFFRQGPRGKNMLCPGETRVKLAGSSRHTLSIPRCGDCVTGQGSQISKKEVGVLKYWWKGFTKLGASESGFVAKGWSRRVIQGD